MKKYLFLMLLALPMVCLFTACGGDGDDDANAPQNTVVVVKEDGTTSNGSIFSAIDDKNFYLDYIKYTLEESHLTVSGYDKLGFKGVAKIVPKITYKGNTYEVLSIKGYSEEGPGAFTKCNILTSIVIPNSVTLIENDAFSGCTGLTSIFIPNSVTTIGGYALRNCTGLTSITIGNSVTSIGSSAFQNCEGITSCYCYAATPPRANLAYLPYSSTLYVPASSIDAYKNDWVWGQFKSIVAIEE